MDAGHGGTAHMPGFRWNMRVVAWLAVLTAVICGAAIVTDVLSPRDRQAPDGATREAPGAGPGTNAANVP